MVSGEGSWFVEPSLVCELGDFLKEKLNENLQQMLESVINFTTMNLEEFDSSAQ